MVNFYTQFKNFKSFEVILHGNQNKPQKIFCTVKNIENNKIILTANNNENKNLVANIGDSIILYIYTENGIYSANSQILAFKEYSIHTEYSLTYPEDIKHIQRREYFRADININFKLEIEPGNVSDKTIIINAKTQDICGKGISYISETPFPSYNSIKVELYFSDKVIETSAALVYSKQILRNDILKFKHAFVFPTISQKKIDFIVKKCFLHQLYLRKKLEI